MRGVAALGLNPQKRGQRPGFKPALKLKPLSVIHPLRRPVLSKAPKTVLQYVTKTVLQYVTKTQL